MKQLFKNIQRIPVFGYFLQLGWAILRLPKFRKDVITHLEKLDTEFHERHDVFLTANHLNVETYNRLSQLNGELEPFAVRLHKCEETANTASHNSLVLNHHLHSLDERYSRLRPKFDALERLYDEQRLSHDYFHDLLSRYNSLREKHAALVEQQSDEFETKAHLREDSLCFLTSIVPIPCERQLNALRSWSNHGRIYSFNHNDEIAAFEKNAQLFEELTGLGVQFVPVGEVAIKETGKPLVYLNSFLDFISQDPSDSNVYMLLNSDVLLTLESVLPGGRFNSNSELAFFLARGPVFGSRVNTLDDSFAPELTHETNSFGTFYLGFDYFLLRKEHAQQVARDRYVFGQPWWDYYLPLELLRTCERIYFLQNPIAFHRVHEVRWSDEKFRLFGDLMQNYFERGIHNCFDRLEEEGRINSLDVLGDISRKMTRIWCEQQEENLFSKKRQEIVLRAVNK